MFLTHILPLILLLLGPAMLAGALVTYRRTVWFLQGAAVARGEMVTVYYNPQNVREARIKSFIYLWLLPLILGIMGAAFTWITVGQLMGVIPGN